MTRSPEHPLVAVYLQRFDEASGGIPEPRRSELRAELAAHLHEATTADMDDAAVDDVIDELGWPEAVVAEETRTPRTPIRRPWVVAGALLLVSAFIGYALENVPGLSGYLAGPLLWAASLLILAFTRDSITARRPLGTIALVVTAVLPFAIRVLTTALGSAVALDADALRQLVVVGYAQSLLQFAAALVAIVRIGRTGVVPAPWRWAPAWALGVVTAIWIAEQLVGLTVPPGGGIPLIGTIAALGAIARIGSAVVLGALALALGMRLLREPDGPLGARGE